MEVEKNTVDCRPAWSSEVKSEEALPHPENIRRAHMMEEVSD